MPRLLEILVGADFKDNDVVELLRNTISECGCVSIKAEAERHKMPMDRIRHALLKLQGVTCNEETCCVTDVTAFSERMKKLAGGV